MNVNCYAWALGISIESMEGGFPKPFNDLPAPGFFSNDYTNKWKVCGSLQETLDTTEQYMLEDAEVLGLVLLKVDKEYVPKPGEWLVIYETSGNSFHFIRWDFQLGWTEKPGIHPAKDCIDPRTNTTSIYVSYAVHRKYSGGGRPAIRMAY